MTVRDGHHFQSVTLIQKRSLAPGTLELHFSRPAGFEFKPGQKITLMHKDLRRDYSLVNTPRESHLSICVRLVPGGKLTPILDRAECGDNFLASPPFGFFIFQSANRQAVFVATGTGVAPFAAYVRSGVRGFCLLHGVSSARHLYYADELRTSAAVYTPCITGTRSSASGAGGAHVGRVTDYLEHRLPPEAYDFYLCGRGDMIRDATRIIDRKFSDSRVFSEIFY